MPKRAPDHRLGVVFIAFTGAFSAISASFLPGGGRREGLVLPADIIATIGLAYSVWGLAYLRRSFSIIRSEEHTSELQSHLNLVCRLLLEKKKKYVEKTAQSFVRPVRCRQ